jgi:HSP20 family molecular chaperone IbpA
MSESKSDGKNLVPRKSEVTYDNGEPTRNRRVYSPLTDIVETADEILVTTDMPGVDEKCVDITLEKNVLTIHAYPPEETVENYSLVFGEYGVGDFERKFVVSQEVDREKIAAKVKNGVLTVHLPKAGPAKARKIEVRAV